LRATPYPRRGVFSDNIGRRLARQGHLTVPARISCGQRRWGRWGGGGGRGAFKSRERVFDNQTIDAAARSRARRTRDTQPPIAPANLRRPFYQLCQQSFLAYVRQGGVGHSAGYRVLPFPPRHKMHRRPSRLARAISISMLPASTPVARMMMRIALRFDTDGLITYDADIYMSGQGGSQGGFACVEWRVPMHDAEIASRYTCPDVQHEFRSTRVRIT